MAIDFNQKRWEKVKNKYRKWWTGKLAHPICGVELISQESTRPQPPAPWLDQTTCHDFSWTAKEIIDRVDYELEKREFLGDAYPFFNIAVAFGPGLLAAFLRAEFDNSSGHVWYGLKEDTSLEELEFEYDPENVWFKRVKDLYKAAIERWGNSVMVGMVDLGGPIDILHSFRPGQKLLMDFIDNPDLVKEHIKTITDLWFRYFNELHEILQSADMGYTDWAGIYSDVPSYTIQCDVSYMISPAMFEEFVKPNMIDQCRRLDRSICHVDGVGMLNHLDSILNIKELDCVQWIPGASQPTWGKWPQVYQKIAASGKFIQSLGSPFDDLIKIVRQTGKPGKIQHFQLTAEVADVEEPVVVEFDPVKVPAKMVSMVKVFFLGYHPLMLFLRILNIFNRRKQKS